MHIIGQRIAEISQKLSISTFSEMHFYFRSFSNCETDFNFKRMCHVGLKHQELPLKNCVFVYEQQKKTLSRILLYFVLNEMSIDLQTYLTGPRYYVVLGEILH